MSFAEVLGSARKTDEGQIFAVPDTWHQGRTAYGGFSTALCLDAAMREGGKDLPPLRSAQVAMIAPVFGEVEAKATIIRRGRNATWASAELHCNGALAFTASFVFMGPVESTLHINDRPAPEGFLDPAKARAVNYTEHTPAFLRHHFETLHALPPLNGKHADMCRWVRLRDGEGIDPMIALILLADALPPGVMPLMTAWVPVSTMHWQLNLLTPMPVTEDGWWLLRSIGDYAEKGCSSQRMAIWNSEGEPVMTGMQSVALFG